MHAPERGLGALERRTAPVPVPQPGELTIDVEYTALNFADVLARRGVPGYAPAWPFTPGLEVAGRIREVGSEGSVFAPGDRVVAMLPDGGGWAEVARADARLTVPVPDDVALHDAVVAPLTWATALGLLRQAHVSPRDRVLVTSASGGVGTAIAALLPADGSVVAYGAVGTERKLGALHHRYRPVLRAGRFPEQDVSFDVVLDSVGGARFAAVLDAIRPGGRIISYGAAQGEPPAAHASPAVLRPRNISLSGFSIRARAKADPHYVAGLIRDVLAAPARQSLGEAVRSIPFADIPGAHEQQQLGSATGKTIVAVHRPESHFHRDEGAGRRRIGTFGTLG
ncbi:zinc-binding alcohol dehydrogenase family protein [Dactylosporangium sp. NPDC051541]|uniref:zinc-binding alcohol dehydrogenase family protein n=1 Tax=Dactylosporangium sp. NPDC051541 TaxID=3363977 RepID=UPI0037A646D1